jgi:hypothetical protein
MNLTGTRDFTPEMYRRLLEALKEAGYRFQSFEEYCLNPVKKVIVLRHDVDRRPGNAMRLAEIEAEMGIRGSYHFRAVSSSDVPAIISRIASLGHEIAYHYEDVTTAVKIAGKDKDFPAEELAEMAYESFMSNLSYFREYYPVRVISMHGSPGERTDNRLVWKYFDYHECDIICEPYFDLDYSEMLYMTDTGGRWDGDKYNIRDRAIIGNKGEAAAFIEWKAKPVRGSLLNMTEDAVKLAKRHKIHSTKEIILLADSGILPEKLVINTHPQRWHDSIIHWMNESCMQIIKNQIKRLVIKWGDGRTIN